MAPPPTSFNKYNHNKSSNNRYEGKKPYRKPYNAQADKYINHREYKLHEIKQSLTQKARLRKQYFKDLKEMGETIPEKPQRDYSSNKPSKEQTYKERLQISKQRKAEQRKLREVEKEEREKLTEKKRKDREQRKEKFNQKTSKGQPLMGPRIEDLLEKIKKQQD